MIDKVPLGLKNNVYFLVDNRCNISRRENKKKNDFSDDCGAWKSGTPTTKYIYRVNERGEKSRLYLKQSVYCTEKRVENKCVYIPVVEQPTENELLVIHRQYMTLKASSDYKRRITWVSSVPVNETIRMEVAIYEYLGVFPGSRPHGNSKDVKRIYTKTGSQVLDNISSLNRVVTGPEAVYRQLNKNEEPQDRARNTKQVKNKKYYEKRKENMQKSSSSYTRNLADNIQMLENMVHTHPFVQQVINYKDASPAVIVFTPRQINDIRRFCVLNGSVLGVDKTFNLTELHVTATVFKNQAVVRETTGEHPLFIGPAFIHGHSTKVVFSSFFGQIAHSLQAVDTSSLIIGSDDEKALTKAVKEAFPKSFHVLCTRHLRDNVCRKLTDLGTCEPDKREILTLIFGKRGICASDTDVIFDQRVDATKSIVEEKSPNATYYVFHKIVPLLKETVVKPYQQGVVSYNWTNNNSESLNHVIKQAIGWKPQSVSDLVHKLYELVQGQYRDLENALIGRGNFRLSEDYQHYEVNPALWSLKTKEEREKLFEDFLNDKKGKVNRGKYVLSTDGSRLVMSSPLRGKKPGQRKRKRTAKTTTMNF